jgi:IS605 OrfB family transposase
LLDRWWEATRWLWNRALEIRCEAYRECGLTLTGNDVSRWLTQWKRTPGHEWLREVPATCFTQCLRDQDAAFRNFFARRARYPRFKRKSTSGSTHRVVGVDLGLTDLATLSTGERIPNPKRYHARLRYLRQQQRCLARRQKGSRRREKQRLRVAEAHARVRQERQAALHALTIRLVREFDLICIEDLNVKGLGREIHARAVHDVAFSEVRRQLAYKSDWYGKILVEVDRWYPSSKSCSHCRHIRDRLRLDERRWRCPACGTWHDRDVNAARNLLAEGLRQLAGRDDRDLRVDAGEACPEETPEQVLAEEARSGQRNRVCAKQARFG